MLQIFYIEDKFIGSLPVPQPATKISNIWSCLNILSYYIFLETMVNLTHLGYGLTSYCDLT